MASGQGTEVDYIIVGAGSAGCVVAERLTEDADVTVLLLEAGETNRKQNVRIPLAWFKLFKTSRDWAYQTAPDPTADDRSLFWPRGKMLGGTSSMNCMIYMRGNRADYDGWAERGNDGWSFDDVLPVFLAAEDNARGASEYHGAGGPLHVSDLRYVNPLSEAFIEAGIEAGLPANPDFNGPSQEGVGQYQVTQWRGARWSAADAYLEPARKRPNLTVRTQAQATHIVWDGTRAAGVEYVQGGRRVARARREVVLCGGAINSPHLLLLSGVGPADHLHQLGIPVLVDLPGVGQNLHDHAGCPAAYASTQPVSLASAESPRNIATYLLRRRGPLTSNGPEVGGFVRMRPNRDVADLQFHFAPAYHVEHSFANPDGHGFTFLPTLLEPQSRGAITLRSAEPLEPPVIQARCLDAPSDLEVLVDGLKLSRALAHTRAFDAFRGTEVLPGDEVRSDTDLAAYVRRSVETIYHPVGTCRMGVDTDAVVDPQLRVHGVSGLRVIDASVMPVITHGNTNAPSMLIGEKGAAAMRGAGRAPARPSGTSSPLGSAGQE
jgi:choline dehydrogenase